MHTNITANNKLKKLHILKIAFNKLGFEKAKQNIDKQQIYKITSNK